MTRSRTEPGLSLRLLPPSHRHRTRPTAAHAD